MAKPKPIQPVFALPEGVALGDFITYYDEGWRYGRLVEQKGHQLAVLDGYYDSPKERKTWVDLSDVKRI